MTGIQTRNPDHDQSVTNNALDRRAMVPGLYVVIQTSLNKILQSEFFTVLWKSEIKEAI